MEVSFQVKGKQNNGSTVKDESSSRMMRLN